MSRKHWTVVAVAAVALAAIGLWMKSRGAADAPKYRTAAVEQGSIRSVVSATGTLRPVVQVEVGSQVSGTVYRIQADYNSRVRAGQVLCEIEPSSFRARVVQNEAAVVKAEATVKDARLVVGRLRELVKDNYVSQAEVDGADAALEQRLAELKQARALLEVAQVDLDHATIRAPIDGVVIARSIDLGQTVAASLQAPKLFVIANDLSRMQVETRIDEADIGRIRPGLPVSFTVDAYPDLTFDGEVSQVRLEPIVDQGVVTYTTVIRTGNPGQRLKPGMTANVSVLVAQRDDVLKVPAAALRFRPAPPRGRSGGARAGGQMGGGAAMVAGMGGGDRAGGTAGRSQWRRDPGDRAAGGRAGGNPPPTGGDVARGGGPDARMGGRPPAGPGHASPATAEEVVAEPETSPDPPALQPGASYLLRKGRPERLPVMTGLNDGAWVEVRSDQLKAGEPVIVGLDVGVIGPRMQPPPGMGGRR